MAFQASDALQKYLQLLQNENDVDEKPSVITTLRSPYSIVRTAVSQRELISDLELNSGVTIALSF